MTSFECLIEQWEAAIRLEIELRSLSNTKLQCNCLSRDGGTPNTLICPICLGLSEDQPVINQEIIQTAIKLGLALKCRVNSPVIFDRKVYTGSICRRTDRLIQHQLPICENGSLDITSDGTCVPVSIRRLCIEEWSHGKWDDLDLEEENLNLYGTPILRLITGNDIHHPRIARLFLQRLKQVFSYLNLGEPTPEDIQMSCTVCIRVQPQESEGTLPFSRISGLTLTDNIESIIQNEIIRQVETLDAESPATPQRFKWDAVSRRVVRNDPPEWHTTLYEPALEIAPVMIPADVISSLQQEIPEMPGDKEFRFMQEFDMNPAQAAIIAADPDLALYFEELVLFSNPDQAVKWILGEVLRTMKKMNVGIWDFPILPHRLGELINHLEQRSITNRTARKVFRMMLNDRRSSTEIIVDNLLYIRSDYDKLLTVFEPEFPSNGTGRILDEQEFQIKKMIMNQVIKASDTASNKISKK